MATNLKEALETATNGRLQVELYEPGALCQTSDILTYLSQNAFDCAVIFGSTFSGLIPEADLACGIPFAWESSAEIYDVMENYGLLDVIQEAYGELNLKYYWNAHEPNYNVLANFQVESLEDFHGKKIRALGVWGDFLAALGASPTNIAGTEVYQALQLGTIDGALYGWSSLSDSNNIREVAQYALSPSMCFCQMATVVNQDSLNKLPEDLRSIVDETIRLANIGVIGQAHVVGTEKSVRDAIQGGYTELSPLPDDVLAEMREIAVTQTWEELAAKSERMARGIEIIKQQNRDYGRQVDY
ncbi:MAG: TRAP transporter substrate-binding protein DctP [Dysosmobacter welbionis]|mgnify:FL=1